MEKSEKMMQLDIVCPSKGRHDKVMTKDLIPSLKLVVPFGEGEDYKKYNPLNEIIETPKDIKGITATRDWIISNFKNVIMFDDDIYCCWRNFQEEGLEYKITNPEMILSIIHDTAQIAKSIGAYLFGFSKIRRPMEYNAFKPIQHTGYLNGSHSGVLEGHNLSYDLTMAEGEDHYISCLAIYQHRYILIDNRYSFYTKNNFSAVGGCNDYRNSDSMIVDTIKLREKFGEVIILKGATSMKKKVHEGERTLSFPY